MEDSESAALLSVGLTEDVESGVFPEMSAYGQFPVAGQSSSGEPVKSKSGTKVVQRGSSSSNISTTHRQTLKLATSSASNQEKTMQDGTGAGQEGLKLPAIHVQPGTPTITPATPGLAESRGPMEQQSTFPSNPTKDKSARKTEARSASAKSKPPKRESQPSSTLSPQHSLSQMDVGGVGGVVDDEPQERHNTLSHSGSRHSLSKLQHQKKKKEGKANNSATVTQHLPAHGEVQHMEQSLLKLLNQFNSGELKAFDSTCYSLELMESVRDQQEALARKHFEVVGSQLDPVHPFLSDEGLNAASENLSQLISSLEKLSQDIGNLSCLDRMMDPGAGESGVGGVGQFEETGSRMGSHSPANGQTNR